MSGDAFERDLLARLGLPDAAGPSEIDAAHDVVVAYLEAAPHDLRAWAQGQIAAADEAYALLSDPTALRERQNAARVAPPPRARKSAQGAAAAPVSASAPVAAATSRARRIGPLGRLVIAVAAVLGTFAVGYIVYASDVPAVPGLTGTPAPEGTAPAIDTARVAQLMEAIAADNNDVGALQELADIYFASGDYAQASEWETKVLAVKPDDLTAHLALGASAYNIGNSADAEVHWRRVLELDPQNVEAHYDLGFMYFSANPPDVDKTIAEWRLVVEIAPDSDIAKTVSTHLATLEQWQASAAPGSPAASGTPASPAAPASTAPSSPAAGSPGPTAEP